MNVSDIMTHKPITIQPNNTLRQALEKMEEIGCHHLPVLSTQKHLIGIVSERDCREALNSPRILRERWEDNEAIDQLCIRDIMTPAPIVTEPNSPAAEAARLMLVNHINALPVMRAETLVGMITTSDILIAFMNMNRRYQQRRSDIGAPIANK